MAEEKSYYRSMSVTEYKLYEITEEVKLGSEWTDTELSRTGLGFTLRLFKQWVDNGRNEYGSHDLVVRVMSSDPEEFRIKTYADVFNRDTEYDQTPQIPRRYISTKPIDFKRVEIVYDPRSMISKKPISKLEQLL
ncbi:hypothetical protein HYU06_02385 [Candidatus Woesearchaeota archaeon]|nr:hypothetical protein [Candidatus Woesearchaeota archaeon]